ncbi:MAG TPA: DUF6379 domain-containing protein [Microbacterium sp.]|uniref:C-glycoside deglycosidase beta subunit domain-containing protein n=1 Tax=Microbacterium sp. TaxID=51671 RepID=UPI002C49BF8D|nr:DUF6379 domain-containing protein [Microbacterium sp.]HWI32402.1 DUF6379 domain-containing protein [Microbacterium sp.]
MFDRYMIVEDSLQDAVDDGGTIIGFRFLARCAYYRRLIVSMVEDLEITVDDVPIARDAIRLNVAGTGRKTLDDLAGTYDVAWEFGEPAEVVVVGTVLDEGEHELRLTERLRISYAPAPTVTTTSQRQGLSRP